MSQTPKANPKYTAKTTLAGADSQAANKLQPTIETTSGEPQSQKSNIKADKNNNPNSKNRNNPKNTTQQGQNVASSSKPNSQHQPPKNVPHADSSATNPKKQPNTPKNPKPNPKYPPKQPNQNESSKSVPANTFVEEKSVSNAESEQLEAKLKKEEAEKEALLKSQEEAKRLEEERVKQEALRLQEENKRFAWQELKSRQELRFLRDKNLNADKTRPDIQYFKSLTSTITKCSAFAKKCSKLSAEVREPLLKELKSLNLSKYVSEVASSIAAAPLKPNDLDAAVMICSELHQLYSDFASELSPLLVKNFSPSSKVDMAQKRMSLRLYIELFIVGIFTEEQSFFSNIKEVIEVKDNKQLPATLSMVLSFVRSAGRDILGVVPQSQLSKIEEFKQSNLFSPSENAEISQKEPFSSVAYEMVLENVIQTEKRNYLLNSVTNFYGKVSNVLLQSHKKLREVEQRNKDLLATRHEISEELRNEYSKQLEQFENFHKTILSLADMLHQSPPSLPVQEKVTRIKEQKEQKSEQEDPEDFGPWDSEENKNFYESLPDLKDFLPSSLLGIAPSNSPAVSSTAEASQATTDSIQTVEDKSLETSSPEILLQFFDKLGKCSNRSLIDAAAIEFCKFNQRSWRSKLVMLMLQSSQKNRVDNLRYFSRFIAILVPYFKDIGQLLVKKLEDEFEYLYKQKDQTNSPAKLWNIRFLGELVKFRVCPPNTILTLLKRCLDDFIGYNVHVACELLETCGRYLVQTPETKVRTSNLLDQMAQLKNSRQFHVTLEILIDNALETARPAERIVKPVPVLPPIQQYIQKLLYLELSKEKLTLVVQQLRKLPWSQEEPFILKTMLKVYKNKYQHINLIASIIHQLNPYHEAFCIKFVDCLLEEIRVHLEERKFANHQKLVMNITLLGELINYRVADSKILFQVLYSLIRYNTITFPKSGGPTDFSFANTHKSEKDHQSTMISQAWIEDAFRIRLVCTLLSTCKSFTCFGSFANTQTGRIQSRELESFLVYFQRFLFMQKNISPDLNSLIDDTWFIVKPPYVFGSYEEMMEKIQNLQQNRPSFVAADERYSLPYRISSTSSVDESVDEQEDNVVEQKEAAEDDWESEPEAEQPEVIVPPKMAPKPAEDELSKLFDAMLNESHAPRSSNVNVSSKNNSIFAVPLMALKRKAEVLKPAPVEPLNYQALYPANGQSVDDDEEEDEEEDEELNEEDGDMDEENEERDSSDSDDSSENEDSEDDDLDEDENQEDGESIERQDKSSKGTASAKARQAREEPVMNFQLLMRKPGNKPVLGSIVIPVESAMVQRHLRTQEIAQQQRNAMNAVTLKLFRMGEEADAKKTDSDAGLHLVNQKHIQRPQSTTYAAAVEALSTSVPKRSFSPQLDPMIGQKQQRHKK